MTDLPSADEMFVQPWDDLLADEHEYWLKLIRELNLPPLVTGGTGGDGLLDPEEITRQISGDPLLGAKVLAVANSAAMGRAKEVVSLEQAVVYMGGNLVQTIIAAYRMEALYSDAGDYPRDYFYLVQVHAALASVIAYNIAGAVLRPMAAEIGTAALLSRMGALLFGVLPNAPGPEYKRLGEAERLKYETDTFGITGPVLSGQLTRHWGLPEELCALLEDAWRPTVEKLESGQPATARLIIGTANTLAGAAANSDYFDAKVILDRFSTEMLRQNLKDRGIFDKVVDICASTVVQRELKAVKNR